MSRPTADHIISNDGCQVIVPALSISVFFAALTEPQLAGIRALWRRVEDLMAERLRWYMTDAMANRQPLPRGVLHQVPTVLHKVARSRPYYWFRAHGGEDPNGMDAWALDLWIDHPREITGSDRALLGAIFGAPEGPSPVANCLRISVPATQGRFATQIEQLVRQVITDMPSLHGHGGYALLFDDTSPAFAARCWTDLARLAMRHPGYDALLYPAVRDCVRTRIKGVNWLTWLGPQMARGVRARLATGDTDIEWAESDGSLLLKAGAEPQIGDVNRGDSLPAYRRVAGLCRDIICREQAEFGGAFDDELTQTWVHRFDDD